ncbi:MAG: hypothetical protein KC553_05720 [Nitrospina sp.]|nr:hypothetical protein [Nitrospina sp.]
MSTNNHSNKKVGKALLFSGILLASAYFCIQLILVFNHPAPFRDMDWNGDGSVSILEIFQTNDLGFRTVQINQEECNEYFRLKDGLPVKIVCPNDEMQRDILHTRKKTNRKFSLPENLSFFNK